MASTFSGFYVAKSGIQAARANLQITGQNMTNVNSIGYTRQRVDSYAIASSGNNMRYASGELGIGEGVDCSGISQIRDPYLDIRYRAEHAKTGKTDTQLETLDNLVNVFDETKKDGISVQMQDLLKQLRTLAGNPSDTNLEDIVKNSSLLLTNAFKNASHQLSQIRDEQTKSFQNDAIANANELLKNIAHLNQEIKSSEVSGTPSLELIDQRNTMIDKLSEYANIEISSKTVEIGAGRKVSELNIDLISGDKKFKLVTNNEYNQFSTETDSKTGIINVSLKTAAGTDVAASDGSLKIKNEDLTQGIFGGYLSLLNQKGEFDATAGAERGIGYYENVLNKMASDFADIMNKANSTNTTGDYNKPLFTTADGNTTGITAANICISDAWKKATSTYITGTKTTSSSGPDTSSKGENILYMINQLSTNRTYTTNDNNAGGKTLFTTSIQAYIHDISVSVLGLQSQDISRQSTTYNATLNEIDTKRAATSSVDINEEGINLIMYNQALTASSRFMTTMDEAMETIISKMGVIGR